MPNTHPSPCGARYTPALTVAGSDCSGGAGIEADLKTFAAHDVYGEAAITAITAQNGLGVTDIEGVPPYMIHAQIDACYSAPGLRPLAVKTGMLGSVDAVYATASALQRNKAINVVVDPVLIATSGDALADSPEDVARAILEEFGALAPLITPNVAETRVLGGDAPSLDEAFERIHAHGFRAVLFKGGDSEDGGDSVTDILYLALPDDMLEIHRFTHPRVVTTNTHGTGCTLSAAIAANLAQGRGLVKSVESAIDYVAKALQRGACATGCTPGHGPVAHQPGLLKKQ